VPALGEHTLQVLREAGFSAEEVAALEQQAKAKKRQSSSKSRL
jgi:crotonobetainyl-CoA:carnitine CoA-transferase CaiB-like acyl-CoA transferase